MILPDPVKQLLKLYSPDNPLYLVGGAVRDFLLQRPSSDFDFVCTSGTREIARKFAAAVDGDFYVLDDARDTCRVLAKTYRTVTTLVDFAALRGEDIQADLLERDFTINAMAVDLANPDQIIDPAKGGRDLQQKWLRPVKPTSLLDDPVRTIRAVRYAVDLGLKIEPETTALIRSAAGRLAGVSTERKRDELIKILDGVHIPLGIQLMDRLDVFQNIPLAVSTELDASVTLARALEDVLAWLTGIKSVTRQATLYQVSLVTRLGRFSGQITSHFNGRNSSGHSRKALLHLACLAGGDPNLVSRQLGLSRVEAGFIEEIHRGQQGISQMIAAGQQLENVEIYRYFNEYQSAGIDLTVIELARYTSRIGSEFSPDEWDNLVFVCQRLLEAWFEHDEIVNPILPIDGNDLMAFLHCEPGPRIGEILAEMKEESVRRSEFTREEALDWIQDRYNTPA